MADMFISYTQSDRDWAFWLAAELRNLGHEAAHSRMGDQGGEDIYAWMEAHHNAADHVLCVSRTNI
jgi:TIR domain-containing protein